MIMHCFHLADVKFNVYLNQPQNPKGKKKEIFGGTREMLYLCEVLSAQGNEQDSKLKTPGMTQQELLKKAAGEGFFTKQWTYCFNEKCPRCNECVHFTSTQYLPATETAGHAIYPNALKDGMCNYFLRLRLVTTTWGFRNTFTDVTTRHTGVLRHRMMGLLGGRTAYYRYNRGEMRLSPEQQQQVLDLFKQFGYEKVTYDHQQTEIILSK